MITVDLFELIRWFLGGLLLVGLCVLVWTGRPTKEDRQRWNPVTQKWEDEP